MKILTITALTLAMITAVNAQINRTDQGNTFTYGLYKPYSTVSPYSPDSTRSPKNFDPSTNRQFGR
jgi:hypothetical protein